MANKKISDLTAGSALTGTELIEIEQSSTSKYTTPADLKTYIDSIAATKVITEWQGDAGNGSTNTKIPYFTTNNIDIGSSGNYTFSNSATNGLSVTIVTAGVYSTRHARCAQNGSGQPPSPGISLNSAQLTTDINAITAADRISIGGGYLNSHSECSVTRYFDVNDVIRPHADGTTPTTAALCAFTICKVA